MLQLQLQVVFVSWLLQATDTRLCPLTGPGLLGGGSRLLWPPPTC